MAEFARHDIEKMSTSELFIERDASIEGWCVDVIWTNNDYARVFITDRKLEAMGIESTREDIALHIDDLLALLTCSDVE